MYAKQQNIPKARQWYRTALQTDALCYPAFQARALLHCVRLRGARASIVVARTCCYDVHRPGNCFWWGLHMLDTGRRHFSNMLKLELMQADTADTAQMCCSSWLGATCWTQPRRQSCWRIWTWRL